MELIVLDQRRICKKIHITERKNNRLKWHDVMGYIKNKLLMKKAADFLKKFDHEKNMDVDFMPDICKYVMINMMTATHKRELKVVWLLKRYARAIRLFLGSYDLVDNEKLWNK